MEFNYQIKKHQGVNIISLNGELMDRNQAEDLLKDIQGLIDKKEVSLVLDLAGLKYINSLGLTVFINILTKSRKASGEVVISDVNKKIKELLIITKLNKVFNISNSINEAITKLKSDK